MIKQKIAGQSAFDFEKMREIWIFFTLKMKWIVVKSIKIWRIKT